MDKERALEILTQLANEVPLKGPDADLRIAAINILRAALANTATQPASPDGG